MIMKTITQSYILSYLFHGIALTGCAYYSVEVCEALFSDER